MLTTLLAFAVDLINVPFMLLFFGIYVVYTAHLVPHGIFCPGSHRGSEAVPLGHVSRPSGCASVEVSCLRFIMAWVRMTALIGYRKKKHTWGCIQRQKIDFK